MNGSCQRCGAPGSLSGGILVKYGDPAGRVVWCRLELEAQR
jgi:hypothetical protein